MGDLSRPTRATWALVAAVIGSSMSFIDGTAVNVALPILQHDLHASAAAGQWVVESYALFLSALILIGGSLGDLYGRKRIYGTGIAIFAIASIVCALAPSIAWLVAGRLLQGLGGALATPGSLALISANFSGEARGRAIGTWSGASAISAAFGPVLGGTLAQLGSWRWVFIINIPLAALVLAILVLRVDESRADSASRRVDVWGATLATLGLGALVYGLIALGGGVLTAPSLAAIVIGIFTLAGFVVLEMRESHPMVPPVFFRVRRFALANAYTLLLYAALGGSLFFVPFDLINVQHYSPSFAGAALLPMIVILGIFSPMSGTLVARIGARIPLAAGASIVACGFVLFARASHGGSYWTTFFPAAIVLGFGLAALVAPLTTTVMDALEPAHAGIASGINNAVSRMAGLIAIAVLGIVLAATFSATFDRRLARTHVSAATLATLAHERATIVAGRVPSGIASASDRRIVSDAIAVAYGDGFRTVMLVSALLALLSVPIALDSSFRQISPSR